MGKLNVDGAEIQVLQIEEDDYISLTDMVRKIDNGSALIEKWLRNKNTIEFLGIWEEMYNEDFDTNAYDEIMQEAGLNRFIMSVKQWVTRIVDGLSQKERLIKLNKIAIHQMSISETQTTTVLK